VADDATVKRPTEREFKCDTVGAVLAAVRPQHPAVSATIDRTSPRPTFIHAAPLDPSRESLLQRGARSTEIDAPLRAESRRWMLGAATHRAAARFAT
jgi:hypothetical protein